MRAWLAQYSTMTPWERFFRLLGLMLLLAPLGYGLAFIAANPERSLAGAAAWAQFAYDFIRILFPLLIFLFMFVVTLFLPASNGNGEFSDGGLESCADDYGCYDYY